MEMECASNKVGYFSLQVAKGAVILCLGILSESVEGKTDNNY